MPPSPPAYCVYSYWLMLWTVLSVLGVPVCPPTTSWIVASTFTTTATMILPMIPNGLVVGVGSAQPSLRLMVALVEWLFLVVSVARCPFKILDTGSIRLQAVVLMVYGAVTIAAAVDPFDLYFRHAPEWAKGMSIRQFLMREHTSRMPTKCIPKIYDNK